MRHFQSLLPLLLFVCLGAGGHPSRLFAQEVPLVDPFTVEGVTRYSDAIPRPEEVLRYRVGARHTRPHLIVEYFRAVAEATDRVLLENHGYTYEGRPLIHAVVTSAENHRRLEEIRSSNLRISNHPEEWDDGALASLPLVVWMGYGVHGNEASSFEAAMLLLYHLAAGHGPAVDSVLEHTVVLLIPSLNPDGHARHVNWVNANRGRVAGSDPAGREHNEPWPGGRTNSYLFDPNRDWFTIRHPEAQGRLDLLNRWRPQLVTDFHEMGSDSTYFFQPGVPARNHPNIPERTVELTARIGEFHARALDRIGSLYYTQETFDDFFVGKGSTYPDVTGSVGILFEQASSRALRRENIFGIIEFPFTIRNHFATSLSTLEAAVSLRESLLRHHRDFYRDAESFAAEREVQAHLVGLEGDRTRSQELLRMLLAHRIEVYRLARDVEVGEKSFRQGRDFVIPLRQPEARLVSAVLDRITEFEDFIFYDVSSWTLPLAFGVHHAEWNEQAQDLLGERVLEMVVDGGEVVGGEAPFAYLMEWNRYYAPRALFRLQEAGARPLLAVRPFSSPVGGRTRHFERGTVVVPVTLQGRAVSGIHELVRRIAREDHVSFHAVSSAATLEGPDLGSRSFPVLNPPSVALAAGDGTYVGEVGEVWHLLNERMGIPMTLLELDRFDRTDLSRYNTLILAGGDYGRLSPSTLESLKEWIRSGGTLIAVRSAAYWAVRHELIGLTVVEEEALAGEVPYERVEAERARHLIGGAIFEGTVDDTHPLAFGYGERVALFRNFETMFEASEVPGVNVIRYSDEPLLSGYVSDLRLDQLRGTAALAASSFGSGRVVLFADNPNFRAFWYGTNGLFLNAVFFGRVF